MGLKNEIKNKIISKKDEDKMKDLQFLILSSNLKKLKKIYEKEGIGKGKLLSYLFESINFEKINKNKLKEWKDKKEFKGKRVKYRIKENSFNKLKSFCNSNDIHLYSLTNLIISKYL